MSGVHRNSNSIQAMGMDQRLLEAELSIEDIHELDMIRQEILDEYKGGGEHS